MSFLTEQLKITKVVLTKELYVKHRDEILDMLVSQYFRKDPTSYASSYEVLHRYFEEEYEEIFTSDKSYKAGFLYYDENGILVGNFMFRDAYVSCKAHEKALEKMTPADDFYNFYVELAKHINEIFPKYSLKDGDVIFGTNLVFTAKFLENFKGKKVLVLIYAMFVDLIIWWEKNLPEFKYGMWVQLRPSLYTTTMQVFNCVETRDFVFLGDDKVKYKGKIFLTQKKDIEEVKKIWETLI